MNAFRQLLKASGSHPPIGTWLVSANALVAEAIGHAGFDWAVVDTEHTPAGTMEVVQMLQALACTGWCRWCAWPGTTRCWSSACSTPAPPR